MQQEWKWMGAQERTYELAGISLSAKPDVLVLYDVSCSALIEYAELCATSPLIALSTQSV